MPPTQEPVTQTTLLGLCEPLFQYLCRLNRVGRVASGAVASAGSGVTSFFTKKPGAATPAPSQGLGLSYAAVRSEITGLLQQMPRGVAGDYRLTEQLRQIDLPLKFFIDSYIAESKLPFAAEWNNNRMAYEHNELAGDEKFFDIVEETLKDRGAEATERLAVYYACLGLGFTGAFPNQVELLRKMMNDIAPRVQHLLNGDRLAPICPEAYQGVDTTNLVPAENNTLVLVVILFVCFSLTTLVAFIILYSHASHALNNALDEVQKHDPKIVQTR